MSLAVPPSWVSRYLNQLLRNQVIRMGTSYSLPYLNMRALELKRRCEYVMRVLRSDDPDLRNYLKIQCDESDEPGQKNLMHILVLWDTLTPVEKQRFLKQYKRIYSMKGLGLLEVAIERNWEPGHVPPILPP